MVVVSDTVGAPVVPLPVPTAPSVLVLAPLKATTVIEPMYEPELRVAATVVLLTAVGAIASQISAVPGWRLVRSRSFPGQASTAHRSDALAAVAVWAHPRL